MSLELDLQIIARLVLAALFGALIGLEREIHGRTAGFRTHLLVSLGSALFVIVSISFYRMFGNFSGTGMVGVDPARVAAQVVVGIGFLGGGAIIKEQAAVRGLTTAACLWIAAAIGMACGLGMFLISALVTVISLSSLIVLKKLEGLLSRDSYALMRVSLDAVDGTWEKVEAAVAAHGLSLVVLGAERTAETNQLTGEFQIKMHGAEPFDQIVQDVGGLEGVRSVSIIRKAA